MRSIGIHKYFVIVFILRSCVPKNFIAVFCEFISLLVLTGFQSRPLEFLSVLFISVPCGEILNHLSLGNQSQSAKICLYLSQTCTKVKAHNNTNSHMRTHMRTLTTLIQTRSCKHKCTHEIVQLRSLSVKCIKPKHARTHARELPFLSLFI